MRKYLTNPGVRSAAAGGAVLGVLAAVFGDTYTPAWIALGVVWLAAAIAAVVFAHRKAA